MSYIGQRTRAAVKAGKAPGPGGSIAKLAGALLARRMSDLGIAIAGAGGQAWEDSRDARWALGVLSAPASRIAGGTDEVQRNIIGERVLGLPKEPQVDREHPLQGAEGRHPVAPRLTDRARRPRTQRSSEVRGE